MCTVVTPVYAALQEVFDALPLIGLHADTAITNAAISTCDRSVLSSSPVRSYVHACVPPACFDACCIDVSSSQRLMCFAVPFHLPAEIFAGSQWQTAIEIFNNMDTLNLRRDAITYSSTISALAKGKQWSLALQVCLCTVGMP